MYYQYKFSLTEKTPKTAGFYGIALFLIIACLKRDHRTIDEIYVGYLMHDHHNIYEI